MPFAGALPGYSLTDPHLQIPDYRFQQPSNPRTYRSTGNLLAKLALEFHLTSG